MTNNLHQQIVLLRAALPKLGNSKSFAENLIAGFERYGSLTDKQAPWVGKLLARAEQQGGDTTAKPAAIGDLGGILALFAHAAKRLKFPAVVLGVPGFPAEAAIRISIAGERAKFPGSITVTSAEKYERGGEFLERDWYGRIVDGAFQPSNKLNDATGFACQTEARTWTRDAAYRAAVIARLQAFAADPSKVGGEDGRLHGRCCFCRIALTDERSTAVGYGKKCASNFGLAWGARPTAFAAEAVS